MNAGVPESSALWRGAGWMWLGPWLALPLLLVPQEWLSPVGRLTMADPARVAAVCGAAMLFLARRQPTVLAWPHMMLLVAVFWAGGVTPWPQALLMAVGLLQLCAIQRLAFHFFSCGWPAALFFYVAALLQFYGHFTLDGALGWSLSPLFMEEVNWVLLVCQCMPIAMLALLFRRK